MKKVTHSTLVIGVSENPDRYANKAVKSLEKHGYNAIAFGLRKGTILHTDIVTDWNTKWVIDTVTLYINPARQEAYMERIIELKPKRVIFNPGTENPIFYNKLSDAGIPFMEACTLVLLATGQY
jgi:predicted CoA-binding protein